jgi:cytochrome c
MQSTISASPLVLAPPFRDLHLRHPVENLTKAVGKGIVTNRQNMPEFRLDPWQVGDFIASSNRYSHGALLSAHRGYLL